MKMIALIGSPRKNGNCAVITENILSKARENGHETKTVFVYDMNMKGCEACMSCTDSKVEYCIHDDDFTRLAPELVEADCIILASPVYMGQITGPLKIFMDRWYTFVGEEFEIRYLNDKKYITVVTCGAPAEAFKSVEEYLQYWLSRFFNMENKGSILAGDLHGPGQAAENSELMDKAASIGASL